MKIKNYNLKVHQPKEIEYLKELRDSVSNGLDGVERKLVKFVKNIQAIEETLRLIVKMASKAIEEAENYIRKGYPKATQSTCTTCSTALLWNFKK